MPILEIYFDLLELTLEKGELQDKSCQMYNLDESGFRHSPSPPKVICKKGDKHPSAITSSQRSESNCINMLQCSWLFHPTFGHL